jgi:transposase
LHLLRAGCPWRDLPCRGIKWRTVYGYFARWRDLGIWDAILSVFSERAEGRLRFIDSTYVRLQQSGTNPAGGQRMQEMGPSRGGLTTKIHALVDGKGRALKLLLSGGNLADPTAAPELFKSLKRGECGALVGDKGYDSDALRAILHKLSIFPCFAVSRKRVEGRPFHRGYYRKRHRVENFFCVLKRQRRIATRYDKLASSFLAFVTLTSILHWIS